MKFKGKGRRLGEQPSVDLWTPTIESTKLIPQSRHTIASSLKVRMSALEPPTARSSPKPIRPKKKAFNPVAEQHQMKKQPWKCSSNAVLPPIPIPRKFQMRSETSASKRTETSKMDRMGSESSLIQGKKTIAPAAEQMNPVSLPTDALETMFVTYESLEEKNEDRLETEPATASIEIPLPAPQESRSQACIEIPLPELKELRSQTDMEIAENTAPERKLEQSSVKKLPTSIPLPAITSKSLIKEERINPPTPTVIPVSAETDSIRHPFYNDDQEEMDDSLPKEYQRLALPLAFSDSKKLSITLNSDAPISTLWHRLSTQIGHRLKSLDLDCMPSYCLLDDQDQILASHEPLGPWDTCLISDLASDGRVLHVVSMDSLRA